MQCLRHLLHNFSIEHISFRIFKGVMQPRFWALSQTLHEIIDFAFFDLWDFVELFAVEGID